MLITNGLVISENGIEERTLSIGDCEGTLNARGLHIFPALTDMHCHLRDPGYEYKEDIISGCASALRGGFETVCCMPNTAPAIDTPETIRYIIDKAKTTGVCVLPVGAITKGLGGLELTDMAALADAGAVAFSDDGKPVATTALFRAACEQAAEHDWLLLSHCEDMPLVAGGAMNEGERSRALGLQGITRASEDVATARDIIIAETFGARLHICHVSTKGSVQLVREAKARGALITAETCPHYFTLTDDDVDPANANMKMNPPLRTEEDRRAVLAALADGTIDVIATDHAPHSAEEKARGFVAAPMGITGFETALSLTLMSGLPLTRIAQLMAYTPARLLGRKPRGWLLVDTTAEYTLSAESIVSKGKNTPFIGKKLKGKIVARITERGEVIR